MRRQKRFQTQENVLWLPFGSKRNLIRMEKCIKWGNIKAKWGIQSQAIK